jgi:hypothetical protein
MDEDEGDPKDKATCIDVCRAHPSHGLIKWVATRESNPKSLLTLRAQVHGGRETRWL